MIQKGSKVIIRTEDAIYQPCEIISLGVDSITVRYFKGMKRIGKTSEMSEDYKVETIARKKIFNIAERV